MRAVIGLLVAAGCLVLVLCLGRAPAHAPAPSAPALVPPPIGRVDPAPAAVEAVAPADLIATIRLLLLTSEHQEAAKDATCWTTVRMMDAHFADKPIADDVAALKIEACKTLVYVLWRQSSLAATGRAVAGADVDAAMPAFLRESTDALQAGQLGHAAGSVQEIMNRDYHRITENKRYLISLAQEAIQGIGLFAGRPVDIKPLTPAAADRLSAFATVLTTDFLHACGRAAQQRAHEDIREEDMKQAFAELVARLPEPPALAAGASSRSASNAIDTRLLELTRTEIANKVAALRSWNAAIWKGQDGDPHQRQRDLLNRFCTVKMSPEGFDELCSRLELYARYFAWGITPQQHNTFADAINRHNLDLTSGAALGRARLPFIPLSWGLNVIGDLFPRSLATNGDVTVHLTRLPGELSGAGADARDVRLLDYELDAVRDTTVHWSVMQQAWASPEARPADPFVLEMLADRLSELSLFFLRICDAAAQETHARTIDRDLCARVLGGFSFAVPAPKISDWRAEDLARKPAILDRHPQAPFTDGSAAAGFPVNPALQRPGPANANTAGDPMALVDFTGAGIACGDVFGDGLPALFLVGEGGNRLLRNLGHHHFRDVTDEVGITDRRLDDAHQALFVDEDNDGRLDLFIVHSGSPSRLFHQLPNGHFEDISDRCGLATGPGAHDAAWFDYDNDGLLDCFVGHYGVSRPSLDGRNAPGGRLFHNLGHGRFEDVTRHAGLLTTGWTLACVALDVDQDGWPDVFVANDYGRSELFHNNHDGTFSEVGRHAGVDDRGSSMNASVVDIDEDGWPDLFITQIDMFSKSIGFVFPQNASILNINERILRSTFSIAGNKLFRNRHDGTFESIEARTFEPGDRGWGWSATFFDYDNDGTDDCYITNGWLDGTPAGRQHHQFFIGDHGRLYQWDRGGAQSYASNARGSVAADLTGEGYADLVVNNYGEAPRLLINTCPHDHHWIKVRLQGVAANRLGVGAMVDVERSDGSHQFRPVTCGSNYLSQDDTTLTFGLGSAARARAVTVRWPNGKRERVEGPFAADQVLRITEGHGADGLRAGRPAVMSPR